MHGHMNVKDLERPFGGVCSYADEPRHSCIFVYICVDTSWT
jgi:hypothetical protein